jgi:hypothetical protein
MADDERPDAHGEQRDEEVAGWLEVERLDDVTRRRLVARALAETERDAAAAPALPAPARPTGRVWAWLGAAAVLVVVLVVGLALLSANGGDDSEVATRNDHAAISPKAIDATRDVGDFGDLDEPTNLAALRAALEAPVSGSAAPQAAAGDTSREFGASDSTTTDAENAPLRLCGITVPDGATAVAQATGTIDGRRATVVLVEAADGTRTLDAVLEDPCETRHLP